MSMKMQLVWPFAPISSKKLVLQFFGLGWLPVSEFVCHWSGSFSSGACGFDGCGGSVGSCVC